MFGLLRKCMGSSKFCKRGFINSPTGLILVVSCFCCHEAQVPGLPPSAYRLSSQFWHFFSFYSLQRCTTWLSFVCGCEWSMPCLVCLYFHFNLPWKPNVNCQWRCPKVEVLNLYHVGLRMSSPRTLQAFWSCSPLYSQRLAQGWHIADIR